MGNGLVKSKRVHINSYDSIVLLNKKGSVISHEKKEGNAGLNVIDLHNRKLKAASLKLLCEVIGKVEGKINELNLGNNNISSANIIKVLDALRRANSTLTHLYLYGNSLNDDCMKSLGMFIQSSEFIEEVWVGNNYITDRGIEILSEYVTGNKTLKVFDLEGNKGISEKSTSHLMNMIETSYIEQMSLVGTSLSKLNSFVVSLSLNVLKSGDNKIELNEVEITDADVNKMCQIAKEFGCENLIEINLNGNNITSYGAIALFDTLNQCNAKVKHISLTNNFIDDECMTSLGNYIKNNSSIERIDISNDFIASGNNSITDKGIETISKYVIGNKTLTYIDVSFNKRITDKSFQNFSDMATKSYILALNLVGTDLAIAKQSDITNLLTIPNDQRVLDV